MNWFMIIIFLLLFLHVVLLIFDSKYKEMNKQKHMPWTINKANLDKIIEELGVSGIFFRSHNNSSSVILSEKNKEIYIIYSIKQDKDKIHTYEQQTVKFTDIISSEVIVDSHTVISTERGSQLVGIAVGSLFGNTGAIVGGLSGKMSSTENIKTIDIKLTLDDINKPTCKINFLDGDDTHHFPKKHGFKKDSEEYRCAITEVEKWQGMFDVILRNQN